MTLRYEGDPYVRYQDAAPLAPEPLPVGASRTHTIRFDDPPPVAVADKRRRRIVGALTDCLISTYLIQWFLVALPRGISHDYGIPTIVGLPLAIVLAFVWVVVTLIMVNDVWPKDARSWRH